MVQVPRLKDPVGRRRFKQTKTNQSKVRSPPLKGKKVSVLAVPPVRRGSIPIATSWVQSPPRISPTMPESGLVWWPMMSGVKPTAVILQLSEGETVSRAVVCIDIRAAALGPKIG